VIRFEVIARPVAAKLGRPNEVGHNGWRYYWCCVFVLCFGLLILAELRLQAPHLGVQLFLFSRHAMAVPVVLRGADNEETGF